MAFPKFKQFKQIVENQINDKIKMLIVENGNEYKVKVNSNSFAKKLEYHDNS